MIVTRPPDLQHVVIDRRTVPFTVSDLGDLPPYVRGVHFRDA